MHDTPSSCLGFAIGRLDIELLLASVSLRNHLSNSNRSLVYRGLFEPPSKISR